MTKKEKNLKPEMGQRTEMEEDRKEAREQDRGGEKGKKGEAAGWGGIARNEGTGSRQRRRDRSNRGRKQDRGGEKYQGRRKIKTETRTRTRRYREIKKWTGRQDKVKDRERDTDGGKACHGHKEKKVEKDGLQDRELLLHLLLKLLIHNCKNFVFYSV